jgi:hypothetical protein
MTTQTTRPQTGILVLTSITAGAGSGNGGLATNHGEGLVG